MAISMNKSPEIVLSEPGSGRATIKLQGAHVTTWQAANGNEMLFISEKANFQPGTAIRGGVPIVFPQFSNRGPLPKHGFARTIEWTLSQEYPGKAVFSFESNDATLKLWPHHFKADYTISLEKDSLSLSLKIQNTDDHPFKFTAALHTYFRVDDIREVQIAGLNGVDYIDEAANSSDTFKQIGNLFIDSEVDRIYINPPGAIDLISNHGTVGVFADGFYDAVVWNPGTQKASQIPDLNSTDYRHFVCIESAVITRPVTLDKQGIWKGTQKLTVK
jgi:glucose-6-phosphate 1-epimerase